MTDFSTRLVADRGQSARRSRPYTYNQYLASMRVDEIKYTWTTEIENAIVQACLELTRAPKGAVGTATAGGTESVMLALPGTLSTERSTVMDVMYLFRSNLRRQLGQPTTSVSPLR